MLMPAHNSHYFYTPKLYAASIALFHIKHRYTYYCSTHSSESTIEILKLEENIAHCQSQAQLLNLYHTAITGSELNYWSRDCMSRVTQSFKRLRKTCIDGTVRKLNSSALKRLW